MIEAGDLLWQAPAERVSNSQLMQFQRWLQQRHGLSFGDYHSLWQWSVRELDAFWTAVWDFCGVSGQRFDRVRSGNTMFLTQWFEGSRVNYAEHLLRHEGQAGPDEVAIFHCTETKPLEQLSWHELGRQVRIVATRLRSMGIEPGDRVVSYLPNVPETAIAMLATTAIGAVWSAASPEFGAATVVERFSQISPKLILATDGYRFGGKEHDRRSVVEAIIDGLPSLQAIVWLHHLGLATRAHPRLLSSTWTELTAGEAPARENFRFEHVPHDHPLWVLYSSGTTGLPKAIVHSHVGMIVDHLKTKRLQFDLGPGKRMFFYTTTGWMLWNTVVSALIAGASAVLYDGSPTFPAVDSLWGIAEKSQATLFGASPTLVRAMEKAGVRPNQTHDLSCLETIFLAGAPSNAATFRWFYDHVKSDLWVVSVSGGTDLCGGLVGGAISQPVRAGEIPGRMLGMDVHAWDEERTELIGGPGELVVTQPFPSMPLRFWGDEGQRRYRDTYFSMFGDVWRHGDLIEFNDRGACIIHGRSDATLNRFGVRIGTAEIYRVIEQFAEVADSLVICCGAADGGFFMPLFVSLNPGMELTDELATRIRATLREQVSPRHVPDEIIAAPGIPYTLTGKKMEVPIRRIVMGEPADQVMSRDAAANPRVIAWFAEYAQSPSVRARLVSGHPSAA